MTLEQLLLEGQNLIENSGDIFLDDIEGVQDQIFKKIIDSIEKFSVKGKLVKDEDSIRTLLVLKKSLLDAVKGSKLDKKVEKFIKNFDTLDVLNKDTHSKLNKINIAGLDTAGVKRLNTDRIVKGLTTDFGIEDGMLLDIQREIYSNIMRGGSKSDAIEALEKVVKGSDNPIEKHVKTISQDSLSQYDGFVQEIIKDEFNLNAWRYIGSIIKNSRNQCVRWVCLFGGIIPEVIIQDEIDWALTYGSGYSKFLTVTPGTFGEARGGHNCRHRAISFRATAEEVKKAIETSKNKDVLTAKEKLGLAKQAELLDQIKRAAKTAA